MKTFDDTSNFAASPKMCGVLFLISFLGYTSVVVAGRITEGGSDVVAGYAAGATWLGFSISLVMWWEQQHAIVR